MNENLYNIIFALSGSMYIFAGGLYFAIYLKTNKCEKFLLGLSNVAVGVAFIILAVKG